MKQSSTFTRIIDYTLLVTKAEPKFPFSYTMASKCRKHLSHFLVAQHLLIPWLCLRDFPSRGRTHRTHFNGLLVLKLQASEISCPYRHMTIFIN